MRFSTVQLLPEFPIKIGISCIFLSNGIRYDPGIAVGKMVGKPMGRQINKLNARKVETVNEAGRHSDGGGLYLNVTESGGRSWLFMYKVAGRRREMGLGSLRDVPLTQARKVAANARQQLAGGLDPLTARQKPATMIFSEAAAALIESMSPAWRNAKHRAQWTMTLNVYCAPIARTPVADITTDDVLRVLKPLWLSKPETGSRLRGRIERALDFAKARGMRFGENPARWRGHLDALLPKRQKLTRGHHKAMPFDDVPGFFKQLRKMPGIAPAALEFAILTAARSGEVMGGQWSEVDLASRVWTVPATRMKGGREHRVPLSDGAVQILRAMQSRKVSEFIFPGSRQNRPLSVMALEMVLRRAKIDATVHGFRSAFRDWSGERTAFPREVAEAALAHLVGDETERAYRRGDALEKRRALMDAWAIFCAATKENTVVPLKRRKAE
jgi:integrase